MVMRRMLVLIPSLVLGLAIEKEVDVDGGIGYDAAFSPQSLIVASSRLVSYSFVPCRSIPPAVLSLTVGVGFG